MNCGKILYWDWSDRMVVSSDGNNSIRRRVCCAQCSRIRILCFFQISKKHDFLRFFEMTYQKVVKSHQQKFSPQSVKMSSHTSLSDHCNSIPNSWSVIHSEPLLNILIGVYHTHFSVVQFLVSAFLSKMFDVGDLPVLIFGNCGL